MRAAAEARLKVSRAQQQLRAQQDHVEKVQQELARAERELVEARAGVATQGPAGASSAASPAAFSGLDSIRQVMDSLSRFPSDQMSPQVREALDAMWTITTACASTVSSRCPQQVAESQQPPPKRPAPQDVVDLEQQAMEEAAVMVDIQAQLAAVREDEEDLFSDAQLQQELERLSPDCRMALGRRLRVREKSRPGPYIAPAEKAEGTETNASINA